MNKVSLASTNPNQPAISATKAAGTSFREQYAIQQAEKVAQQASQKATQDLQNLQREEELKRRVAAEQAAKQQAQQPQLGIPVGPSKASMIIPGGGTPKAPTPVQYTMPGTAPSAYPAPSAAPAYSAPPSSYESPSAATPSLATPDYGPMPSSGGGGGGMPSMPSMPFYEEEVGYYSDAPAMTASSASKAIVKVESTPAAEAKKSIWERILAFFGLAKAVKPSFTGEDFEQEIRDIVDRARAGDQNATGLIVEITKNAEAGNAKAMRSAKAIDKYIAQKPVGEPLFGYEGPIFGGNDTVPTFGHEGIAEFGAELSRYSIIPNTNIRRYLAQFGEEGKQDFAHGFWNAEKLTPHDKKYHRPLVQQGKAIGIARRLQASRMGLPNSPRIAWEMGE